MTRVRREQFLATSLDEVRRRALFLYADEDVADARVTAILPRFLHRHLDADKTLTRVTRALGLETMYPATSLALTRVTRALVRDAEKRSAPDLDDLEPRNGRARANKSPPAAAPDGPDDTGQRHALLGALRQLSGYDRAILAGVPFDIVAPDGLVEVGVEQQSVRHLAAALTSMGHVVAHPTGDAPDDPGVEPRPSDLPPPVTDHTPCTSGR